jgi:hypothetical protein
LQNITYAYGGGFIRACRRGEKDGAMTGYAFGNIKSETFAEACGIELKGENKWITLIQNAGGK